MDVSAMLAKKNLLTQVRGRNGNSSTPSSPVRAKENDKGEDLLTPEASIVPSNRHSFARAQNLLCGALGDSLSTKLVSPGWDRLKKLRRTL